MRRLLPFAFLLLLAPPAHAAVTVRQASGTGPSAIQTAVSNFQADLGAARQQITWEDAPNPGGDPDPVPADFYKSRGLLLSAPGQTSASEFGTPLFFATFSPPRLFRPASGIVTEATFVVPGTATPALSRGFGAVFTNVDTAGASKIELLDASGAVLVSRNVPPATGNETLSFLGISLAEGRVAKVRVTSGSGTDVTVLDDFIFGTPVKDGADADGVSAGDNCPDTPNSGQEDLDADGLGDVCDPDADGDGIANERDAFPLDTAETRDSDGDGSGDNADTDDDNDGLLDTLEARAGTDPHRADTDADGRLDGADDCPLSANPDQADRNADGLGDACDDSIAPVVSRLRLRPSRFRTGTKNGTRVSFRLTEAAAVRLVVKRAVRGRWATVHGRLLRGGTAGVNFVRFDGRVGTTTLEPGRYLLVASATDTARNTSRTARAKFRVLP